MYMKCYFSNKRLVAEYVDELLQDLKQGYVLTMTTRLEKSGGYCVTSVTEGSLEDIETLTSFEQQQHI